MKIIFILSLMLLSFGCQTSKPNFDVDRGHVKAGSEVTIGDETVSLYKKGQNISVGQPAAQYINKISNTDIFKGKVAIVNIVPSIDTAVCEGQTHILGEDPSIAQGILRVTISRDLPMAQSRFAKAAKLTNIIYLSDFKSADFGKASGLLMEDKGLLARAVFVVDQKGVVRHLQIVPDVRKLPDMKMAIKIANELL